MAATETLASRSKSGRNFGLVTEPKRVGLETLTSLRLSQTSPARDPPVPAPD